ncbi:Jag N-terminal domain-containing protein [Sutcliffiella cohnii]
MESIVSKGKDVNEAINLGLSQLDTSIKEVSIELLQHEKKGFLKIGSKKAIVKLMKIADVSPQVFPDHEPTDEFNLVEEAISFWRKF